MFFLLLPERPQTKLASWCISDNSSADGASCTLTEGTYALFNRLGTYNCISFTVKTSSDTDKFGMSFVRGTDSKNWYSFICQYEDWAGKRKVNFENEGEGGKGFIDGSDSVLFPDPEDNEFEVTVYTDNSVVTVYTPTTTSSSCGRWHPHPSSSPEDSQKSSSHHCNLNFIP